MERRSSDYRLKYSLGVFVFPFLLLGAGCTSTISVVPQQEAVSGTKLDLSNRGITQVSDDVFHQTDLIELDLSGNLLSGSVPAEIRLLSKLEVLDLSDNAMTGLPAEVGQLKFLKTLDLSNNQLTGLPLELGQLTALETLDLRGNAYSAYDLSLIQKNLSNTKILVD